MLQNGPSQPTTCDLRAQWYNKEVCRGDVAVADESHKNMDYKISMIRSATIDDGSNRSIARRFFEDLISTYLSSFSTSDTRHHPSSLNGAARPPRRHPARRTPARPNSFPVQSRDGRALEPLPLHKLWVRFTSRWIFHVRGHPGPGSVGG